MIGPIGVKRVRLSYGSKRPFPYLYVTEPHRYGCGTYFRRLTYSPPEMSIKNTAVIGLEPSAVFLE